MGPPKISTSAPTNVVSNSLKTLENSQGYNKNCRGMSKSRNHQATAHVSFQNSLAKSARSFQKTTAVGHKVDQKKSPEGNVLPPPPESSHEVSDGFTETVDILFWQGEMGSKWLNSRSFILALFFSMKLLSLGPLVVSHQSFFYFQVVEI